MNVKTLKVEIIKGFVVGRDKIAHIGEEIELAEHVALQAIQRGQAKLVQTVENVEKKIDQILHRDPQPQNRDPKGAKQK